MANRYAIIENEIIVNVIVADNDEFGGIQCEDRVCVGWKYIDGEFIAPPVIYKQPNLDNEAETI